MNMPLFAAAMCAMLAGCALARLWATGRVGFTGAVRTRAQAREVLVAMTNQAAATQRDALSASTTTADEAGAAAHASSTPVAPTTAAGTAERTRRRDQILDAAVPGGLALGDGIYGWLTPDPAAVSALEHVTETDIETTRSTFTTP